MKAIEEAPVYDGKCEGCGNPEGFLCIEPYSEEIGNVIYEVIYCDSCYSDSANDI